MMEPSNHSVDDVHDMVALMAALYNSHSRHRFQTLTRQAPAAAKVRSAKVPAAVEHYLRRYPVLMPSIYKSVKRRMKGTDCSCLVGCYACARTLC